MFRGSLLFLSSSLSNKRPDLVYDCICFGTTLGHPQKVLVSLGRRQYSFRAKQRPRIQRGRSKREYPSNQRGTCFSHNQPTNSNMCSIFHFSGSQTLCRLVSSHYHVFHLALPRRQRLRPIHPRRRRHPIHRSIHRRSAQRRRTARSEGTV